MVDERAYRDPDWDPQKATVLDLISILSAHDVPLPASRQRKAFYVDLFRKEIPPLFASSSVQTKTQPTSPFFSPENPFQRSSSSASAKKKPVHENIEVVRDVSPPKRVPAKTPNVKQKTPLVARSSVKETPGTPMWSVPGPDTPYTTVLPVTSPLLSKPGSPGYTLQETLLEQRSQAYEAHLSGTPLTAKPRRNVMSRVLILGSLFALVGGLLLAFQQDQRLVYCTEGQSMFDFSRPLPLKVLPLCLPCPSNAVCTEREISGCVSKDFIQQPLWITKYIPSQFLFFPLDQGQCLSVEKVRAKETRVLARLFVLLNESVRRWTGDKLCNASALSTTTSTTKGMPLSIAKTKLRQTLLKKNPKWDDSVFDGLWDKVLLELSQVEDKKIQTPLRLMNGTDGQTELLVSKEPPLRPFTCRLRMGLLQTVQRREALWTFLILSLITYIYRSRQRSLKEALLLTRLHDDLLDAIQQETERHYEDKIRHPLPGLSVSQLRDHFLPLYTSRQRALKPLDPDSRFPCESDVNGRTRWFLNDKTRSRIWSQVYSTLVSNASVQEVAMELNAEAHGVLMFVGSKAFTPKAPSMRHAAVEQF